MDHNPFTLGTVVNKLCPEFFKHHIEVLLNDIVWVTHGCVWVVSPASTIVLWGNELLEVLLDLGSLSWTDHGCGHSWSQSAVQRLVRSIPTVCSSPAALQIKNLKNFDSYFEVENLTKKMTKIHCHDKAKYFH